MIITRSPLRITLGGGGTDLPSYYKRFGGFLISAAIDKYVYTSVLEPYADGIFLKYSKTEKIKLINKINHPIIREVLKKFKNNSKRIEITTLAEIPSGTGLGSSGSFTTSLIKAMYQFNHKKISKYKLAEESCDIEINKLKEPVGKQDQYIASFGGLKVFKIDKSGKVVVSSLKTTKSTFNKLQNNLLLFFTGYTRSSSIILKKQNDETKNNRFQTLENLKEIKKIGFLSKNLIENSDLDQFGKLLDYHWKIKKERATNMSNERIDSIYDDALNNGALGGKLVGAGGGGFLMFYAKNPNQLRKRLKRFKINEVKFSFDQEGTKII
jgi:D-glycero-alpha-D-manno-heptose-7-phosphate kinase